jgi:hypothetical protein
MLAVLARYNPLRQKRSSLINPARVGGIERKEIGL